MMRVLSSSKTKWHFMQTQCAMDGDVTHFCGSKDGTRQRQTRNQPSLTIVLYDADSHRRQQINVVIVSSSSHSGETDIRLILLSPRCNITAGCCFQEASIEEARQRGHYRRRRLLLTMTSPSKTPYHFRY